jgi:tRNA U34 5-methylaminomethyl-2-thiouridine-forming methyltransferase MnmC
VSELQPRRTGDGSFSLWSPGFSEGFHCAAGALGEARASFVAPAELNRFPPGRRLRVVEVCVGTGTNTATLLAAAARQRLAVEWWGLECDPAPLALALADAGFRRQWPEQVVTSLERLRGSGRFLLGDARERIAALPEFLAGGCDLVLLDAFSPRRCPQLWTVEFLGSLARLLAPEGRLLTYCAAAAVRRGLQQARLHLASIAAEPGEPAAAGPPGRWSLGTVASPSPLATSPRLRPLSPMEREHLATRAAEPYRDPTGRAAAAAILAGRARAQASGGAEPAGTWRRRWGIERRGSPGRSLQS